MESQLPDPTQGYQWIPGQCVSSPRVTVQSASCPTGYVWRKGHFRKKPSVESTHKYFKKFDNKVKRVFVKHPVLCQGFETLEEFQDCLKMVRRSMQAFLLKNPSRSEIKDYSEHLIDRVILCAGKKLQNKCYFQPTVQVRRYINARIPQNK